MWVRVYEQQKKMQVSTPFHLNAFSPISLSKCRTFFFSPDSSESTVGFVHSTLLCQMIKEKIILHEGLIQNEKSVTITFCVLHIFADTALFVVDHEQLLSSSKKKQKNTIITLTKKHKLKKNRHSIWAQSKIALENQIRLDCSKIIAFR